MSSPGSAFTVAQVGAAAGLTTIIQIVLFGVLMAAGSKAHVQAKPVEVREEPIAVKPILDELPLLKLGSKKQVKPKLPDMWKKNPPVQRFEEASAPSAQAPKTPEALPTSKVAKLDAEAPPPDAEIAKQVDQVLLDAGPDVEAPELEEEGAADGVKEGTETDPLKARAVSQYQLKIIRWFNSRWSPPTPDQISCDVLKDLSIGIVAHVGPDRTVTGFSVTGPSGNPIFDNKAQSTMQSVQGQELPPPPPLYPDILSSSVSLRFSGKQACD